MPQCPIDNPALLLPHSGRMVLLDRVLRYDGQSLDAVSAIRPDCILLPPGADSLPAYLGMEIMAQGIGAWAGAQALDRGEPVRLGFLLGTRRLHIGAPATPVGTAIAVSVHRSLQDAIGMGVFDCTLSCLAPPDACADTLPPGTVLLRGALNVLSPTSDAMLEKMLGRPAQAA